MGVEILQATMNARNEWERRFFEQARGWERRPGKRINLRTLLISLLTWVF